MPNAPAAILVTVLALATPEARKGGAEVSWPSEPALRAAVSQAWAQLAAGGGWTPHLSPPLPAVWPPDGQGALVAYAYASRRRDGLGDGEETAGAWGRVVMDKGLPVVKDRGALRPLGIQGVRPLRQGELAIARSEAAAIAALEALVRGKTLEDAPTVRRYYCFWQSTNGVIAGDLQARHTAFFRWLDCAARP
jgi:hypothetical protein